MQPALLCSAPVVKPVFGVSERCKHRIGAYRCKQSEALACRHLNKLSGACIYSIYSMRHASPTARRDTLARAEERDSLLVRWEALSVCKKVEETCTLLVIASTWV